MVELLVSMAIVVILTGVIIFMFMGARQSARQQEAAMTANSYLQAIAMYMSDHGNRVPHADADWFSKAPCVQLPASPTGAPDVLNVSCGPVNPLGNMYMREVPPSVAQGRTQVCLHDLSSASPTRRYPGSCGSTTALTRVIYQARADGLAYAILTYVRKNNSTPFPSTVSATLAYCVAGSDTAVTAPVAAKKPRSC